MTPYLGLILILVLTFIGVRFFGKSTILKTPLFSGLLVSGIPYILIGVILGPQFFNFLNEQIMNSLEPLLSLAIGWVGMLFGIQLRWRHIQRFPANYLLFSTTQSLLAFIVITMILGGVLFYENPVLFNNRMEGLLILAALGSITAPTTIARAQIEKKSKGRLTNFIQFISSLDSFWGIVIAGVTMSIFHQPAIRWFQTGWHWTLLLVIISILLGMLFRLLLRFRFTQEEIFLLILGIIIFTSGAGFYLRLSPILMTTIVGITIAQFPRESEKVLRVIHTGEKPTYLFLLIFAGAMWNYRFWEEILLIMAFIVARYLGKYIGGYVSAKKIPCDFPIPPDIGKGMMSLGGVSLAIAFNYQLYYGGFMGDFLMSATIIGLFLFDEYSALSILSILKNRREIK